jgi:hypothetical protein
MFSRTSSLPWISGMPSDEPSETPSLSGQPSVLPSSIPSLSAVPNDEPPSISGMPSDEPSETPSLSGQPSVLPSSIPSLSAVPNDEPPGQRSLSGMPSDVHGIHICLSSHIEFECITTFLETERDSLDIPLPLATLFHITNRVFAVLLFETFSPAKAFPPGPFLPRLLSLHQRRTRCLRRLHRVLCSK